MAALALQCACPCLALGCRCCQAQGELCLALEESMALLLGCCQRTSKRCSLKQLPQLLPPLHLGQAARCHPLLLPLPRRLPLLLPL